MVLIKRLLLGVSFGLVSIAMGSGWQDFLSAIAENQVLQDDGQLHQGEVYNASITYRVDGNNDHKLGSDEKVYLKVVGPDGRTIETPQGGYTKSQLIDWAKGHSNDLLIAIFGAEPAQGITGTPSSTDTALTMVNLPNPPHRKRKVSLFREKLGKEYNSFIVLNSENSLLVNEGQTGRSTAGVLQKDIGDNFGIAIGYRQTKMGDRFNSKSYFLNLSPYFRYSFDVEEQLRIDSHLWISGSALYTKSKLFPDGAGYLQYGFGGLLKPTYLLYPDAGLYWNMGVGFQWSKKYIPKSWVPEEMKFVAEAVNNLPADKMVILSTAIGVSFTSNIKGETGTIYAHHLKIEGVDRGRNSALYHYAKLNATFGRWEAGIGYKYVTRVTNYRERAYMLSLRYNF